MVFSATVFLFLFLPIVLIGYYAIRSESRNIFLLIASLFFYAWGEGVLVLLMLVSICINYISGIGISHYENKKNTSKLILGIAITINLLFLIYYKYFNFIIENCQEFGFLEKIDNTSIALPIGISFFTFQGISYLIDVYRKETEAQNNPFHLGLYISLFPQLIAGPIIRYHDIAVEIKNRKVNSILFTEGVIRFIRGLGKKVVIANTAALIADKIFVIPPDEIPFSMAWLGIICYAFQIYFDFSGYSDMAIGLGKMFGFNFKENFNYPYISSSIQDFWRRWHISLSTWFRDYLYIPLGGNRNGAFRTYLNLIIVFFITGLWHGASWNFIVWGLFHGVFLLLERTNVIPLNKLPRILKHVYVLFIVIIGWVFFRAESLPSAMVYLKSMFGFSMGSNYEPMMYINNYSLFVLLLAFVFSMPVRNRFNIILNRINHLFAKIFIRVSYLLLFVYSVLELAQSSYNPFIYFRF